MRIQRENAPLDKAERDFFQEYFIDNRNILYHEASAYTSTEADRDDLVQEAVVRLMKNIPVLRQLTRCKSTYYIVITVRTAYIDMARRRKDVTILPLNNDDDVLTVLDDNELTSRNETNVPMRMAVKQLKESLPEQDWVVLVSKFIMGYTHEELGRLLGMRPASVRMALTRAKAKARVILQDEHWMGGGLYE